MKVKKVLKILGAVLGALILLVVLVGIFWLGPAVKAIAQRIGTKALGTPVRIEALSIRPFRGLVDLNAFTIETHEGFNRTNTWSLASLHINIDMRSLFTDTITVHEITINAPRFTYEQNSASDNIAEVVRALQDYSGTGPDAPPAKSKAKSEKKPRNKKPPKRVIVESLIINNLHMAVANTDDPSLDIECEMEQLSLSFTNGIVQLRNLSISNPDRLATPHLMELSAIEIKIDPASIYSGTLVIDDVQIRQPHAFLEQNPETDTVAEFLKIAESFTAKAPAPEEEPSADAPEEIPEPESESGPPPLQLKNLTIDDIRIHLVDLTLTNAPAEPRTMASITDLTADPLNGRLTITDIAVPSPPGFSTTNLFHLAELAIEIDPASLHSTQTVVRSVLLDSPKLIVEQSATTGNAAELQKIIEGFLPQTPETAEGAVADLPDGPVSTNETISASEPRSLSAQPVVLEALVVTNLAMHMILPGETNATVMGRMSKLNPLEHFNHSDTNAPTDEVVVEQDILHLLTFEQLTIKPLEGNILLTNLQLGNPPGFANDNLLELQRLNIDLATETLQTETLMIRDVLIEEPKVSYERKLSTDNIEALQVFLASAFQTRSESMSGDEASADEEGEPAPEEERPDADTSDIHSADVSQESGQKVIIEHLLVKDGTVRAKLSALPTAPIALPDIEKTDIGKEEGGATVGSALSSLYESFYDAIIDSVSSVTGFAGDALKGAGALTLGAIGSVTGGATDGLAERLHLDEEETETHESSDEKKNAEPEPPAEEPKKSSRRERIWRRPGKTF